MRTRGTCSGRDVDLAQILRINTASLRSAAEDSLWIPDEHVVLIRAGRSIGGAGQVETAVAYFAELADQAQRRLGHDHPDALITRSDLAFWRGKAGKPNFELSRISFVLIAAC
jgi:hypothetical protein